jgi:hypothetical protein
MQKNASQTEQEIDNAVLSFFKNHQVHPIRVKTIEELPAKVSEELGLTELQVKTALEKLVLKDYSLAIVSLLVYDCISGENSKFIEVSIRAKLVLPPRTKAIPWPRKTGGHVNASTGGHVNAPYSRNREPFELSNARSRSSFLKNAYVIAQKRPPSGIDNY